MSEFYLPDGHIFKLFDTNGNEIWSWNTFDYFPLTEYNPYWVQPI